MNLRSKRRLAADTLGVGKDRIIFDPEAQDLIQDAITRSTIRGLVGMGGIKVAPIQGVSRGRARLRHAKGKSRKPGSFRGAATARRPRKEAWMIKVRALRWRLKVARSRNEIGKEVYRKLYGQVKGGQIRDVKHLIELMKEGRR
ncbi:MAG: 50S ribosomal protein L19e [Thaumarchaeota archaeon]|nr:50S ribosomal protein L19e [Nitrososphaerota archaeon]MDA4135662.1 50S ribosomal protein L19e [Nitrososphaerota archaeon]